MRSLIVASVMNVSKALLFSSVQEASDTPLKATRLFNSCLLCKVPLRKDILRNRDVSCIYSYIHSYIKSLVHSYTKKLVSIADSSSVIPKKILWMNSASTNDKVVLYVIKKHMYISLSFPKASILLFLKT